jgi:hypothetical protein
MEQKFRKDDKVKMKLEMEDERSEDRGSESREGG